MTDPTLFITVGVPGSGKTTFSKRQTGVAVISRDVTRELFGAFDKHKEKRVMDVCKNLVQGYLLNGQDALFDSTAPDARSRRRIVLWAEELFLEGLLPRTPFVVFLYFPCSLEDSIARRQDVIPPERLKEMHGWNYQPKYNELPGLHNPRGNIFVVRNPNTETLEELEPLWP